MPDTIYAVTRVHNQEQNMLGRADIDRLLAAKTTGEALRLLRDKGWGAPELPDGDIDALIEFERARVWALVEELAGDMAPFVILRLSTDYHNLKAAIKLAYAGRAREDAPRYMLPGGTILAETLLKAAAEHDFSTLSPEMAQTARSAYEALLHTSNSLISDAIVDSGLLTAMDRAGRASPSLLIRLYARMTVDAAVVKIALRASHMGLARDFLETAIPCAGSLDRDALIASTLSGEGAVLEFLRSSEYAGAANEGRRSVAALERWFDDCLMERLRPQRYVYEGIEPIAAYLIGREHEIGVVRLILSAKANNLKSDLVAERLRALYG